MNLNTFTLSGLYSHKLALVALVTLGAAFSLPSHAAQLSAKQQQVVNSHFNKLAQSQYAAEQRMTERLDREFTLKLTEEEYRLMRQTCPKYGMTFDTTTNACLRP